MKPGYKTVHEHRQDALVLVRKLLERQVRAHWELGLLPPIKDEFSGRFVSDGEVEALLAGGRVPGDEATARLVALDREIARHASSIEARLANTPEAPFEQLRTAFALSPTEQRVLWVLIAAEISPPHRQLCRYLVNDAARIHPDLGLLQLLVYSAPDAYPLMIRELGADSPLVRHRLVDFVGSPRQNREAPFLMRPLKVTQRVVELVYGVVRLDRELGGAVRLIPNPPRHDHLIIAENTRRDVDQLLSSRSAATQPAVLLAGPEGAGRKSLCLGAAAANDCSALLVDCAALPTDGPELARQLRLVVREAILFRSITVFDGVDSLAADVEAGRPDRTRTLEAALDGYIGPVAATCKRQDARPLKLDRGVLVIDVPKPTEQQRVELWRRELGEAAPDLDAARVAARYPITGGVLQQAARSAGALARARANGSGVTEEDIHAGLRGALDVKLSVLGRRVLWRQNWDDLVLPEDSFEEIKEFLARVKHRRRVHEEWGFSRKLAKGLGLSALFAGPPGTGKTMVAGIIADELALDLYQIDLSRIVSKYVGETEKNLAELFDAAESGHAILLFDEADSLFAKRTEVKSSVDRYANLEVNYLLQRMEEFNGITILTTNLESSIDEAFKRRISFRVNFPFPEPEERERLWRAVLPAEAAVDGSIDYAVLAEKYEMSGGYIRNAVLRAAFLAADEASPITMQYLLRAATLEYAGMGKVVSSFA